MYKISFGKYYYHRDTEGTDTDFHKMINQALLGIYLADQKVQRQKEVKKMARHLLNKGGAPAYFFFFNGRIMANLRSKMG
ncbi:hypothetical protein DSM106972_084930 [Dulcicalothrix desertica PCC 7102]|uniref:Uncharacterized protein n=1 Tax=Dulcicalothrix desertica PCC 7102 TaxID=232991 RepID=A0A433UU74_9CYAN|nr:DUF2600 family protein [Dulcicalothrix desertica]RUS97390.1 hypothetical protein DSM106972_084930 [Dulcicalothrix desertica PCC 7102]